MLGVYRIGILLVNMDFGGPVMVAHQHCENTCMWLAKKGLTDTGVWSWHRLSDL